MSEMGVPLRAVLRANGRLWIPLEVCEALQLGEDAVFEVEMTADGAILLRPTGERIDPDQAWFWTPEWQAGERRADRDAAEGRSVRFASDEEFLRALDEGLTPEQEAQLRGDATPQERVTPRADV